MFYSARTKMTSNTSSFYIYNKVHHSPMNTLFEQTYLTNGSGVYKNSKACLLSETPQCSASSCERFADSQSYREPPHGLQSQKHSRFMHGSLNTLSHISCQLVMLTVGLVRHRENKPRTNNDGVKVYLSKQYLNFTMVLILYYNMINFWFV